VTRGLPSDYTFEYFETTGTNPTSRYVVDVRNDVVSRVYSRDIPSFDAPPIDPTDFPTIPDLFTMIQEVIDESTNGPEVQYNTQYGYPQNMSLRPGTADAMVIEIPSLTPYTILSYELDTNTALWESYGEDSNSYSFVTKVTCFCQMEYITPKFIVVENDAIIATTDVETGALSDFEYDTILGLFSRIQQAINRYDVTILATFNETFGYPLSVYTNPDFNIMDGDISIQVSELTLGRLADGGESQTPTTLPPTGIPPTLDPATTRWCFGFLKFTAGCRQNN